MSDLRDIEPVLPDGTFYRLEYNGFRFDPAATETLSMSLKPVQDAAQRTVKYVEVTLQVRTVLYVGAADPQFTTDAAMDDLVQRLMSQGAYLVYQGKGFGRLNINTGLLGGVRRTAQWDAKWGPTPTGAVCKPLGDNRAWEVVWGVKVCVPECDQARYQNTVMAFNYEVEYANDYGGYTTRTVRGSLEIPLTRPNQGDRRVTLTADAYRDQIVVQCPAGYRAVTPGDFVLSADRTTLSFTFVHEQLPGIVPPLGVLKCSLSMKTSNQNQMDLVNWYFTISATYEMAAGRFQIAAADHFRRVVADRILQLSKVCAPGRGGGAPDAPFGGIFGGLGFGIAPGVFAGIAAVAGAGAMAPVANKGAGAVAWAPGDLIRDYFGDAGFSGAQAAAATASANQAAQDAANLRRAASAATAGVPPGAASRAPYLGATTGAAAVAAQPGVVATDVPAAALATAAAVAAGGVIGGLGPSGVLVDDALLAALAGTNCCVLPIFYSAEDPDAYGKPMARFDCTLAVFGTLPQLLNAGLWEPVIDTPTWQQWRKSLGRVWDNRGVGDTGFNPNDDVIIDVCRPVPDAGFVGMKSNPASGAALASQAAAEVGGAAASDKPRLYTPGQSGPGAFPDVGGNISVGVGTGVGVGGAVSGAGAAAGAALPPPAIGPASNQTVRAGSTAAGAAAQNENAAPMMAGAVWLEYQNHLSFYQGMNLIDVKLLPTDPILEATDPRPAAPPVPAAWASGRPQFDIVNSRFVQSPPTKITSNASPNYYVRMTGSATAVGFPPQPPQLVSVAGVPAVLAGAWSSTEIVGNVGAPIFQTIWRMDYRLPQGAGQAAAASGGSRAGAAALGGNNSRLVGGGGSPTGPAGGG